MQLVECIPNFSEGRRPDVIRAIYDAIAAVPGLLMLDRSSDHDHNRTVITFAGEPHAVVEGAFAGIKTAAELIDLDEHRGVHPRMGAADVVPFVPLEHITLEECANLARKLGMRVGSELNLPVFLYEAAATRPDHISLADVRRGEYEGLKETIGKDDTRTPDFGPLEVGKAGAVIIGARRALIAFNVYLNTDDVEIAKTIARSIRQSSGGLAFLRALGLLVNGKAQVSMNLLDHTRTPIPHVMEMIRTLAMRYGVHVQRSELIGLMPQAAVTDTASYYLQLDGFTADRVLEYRMDAVRRGLVIEDKEPTTPLKRDVVDEDDRPTLHALPLLTGDLFLSQLASGTPTPGGGAAAAYSAAMGAALVAMVARTTLGKKKYVDVGPLMAQIIRQADTLRRKLEQAARDDAAAFDALIAAYRMSADEERRSVAVEGALRRAAEVPLSVMRMAIEVMQLALDAAEQGNKNAAADAAAGAMMAHAALKAAEINVRVNVHELKDQEVAERWIADELKSLRSSAEQCEARIRKAVQERTNVEL